MIYKLSKQSKSEWIIQKLPKIWKNLNWLAAQLLDESRITFTTVDLIIEKDSQQNISTAINSFYAVNHEWFAKNYPLYNDALIGAANSLQAIIDIIDNGLQTYYWDKNLDKPVIANMTMQHRVALANLILNEIE